MLSTGNRDFLSLLCPPALSFFSSLGGLGEWIHLMLPLLSYDPLHVFNRYQLDDSSTENRLGKVHRATQRNLVLSNWGGDLPVHFSLGRVTYENGAMLAQRRNVVWEKIH